MYTEKKGAVPNLKKVRNSLQLSERFLMREFSLEKKRFGTTPFSFLESRVKNSVKSP